MPISLICGACEAKLTAPDAAAGKKVKCRQCGVILEIPLPEPEPEADFEIVEEAPTKTLPALPQPKPTAKAPPAAPAAKPKPKPVMMELADDEDEDDRPAPKKKSKPVVVADEDDEDDRPVKPKKKPVAVVADDEDDDPKPKKPGKKAVIVDDDEDEDNAPKKAKKGKGKAKKTTNSKLPFLIGGGILGLALVGFLVYWFALREPDVAKGPTPTPNNPNGPGPVGPGPVGPGPGPQPQPRVPSKAKPASGEWDNYSCADFDIWIPKGKTFDLSTKSGTLGPEKHYLWDEKVVRAEVVVVSIPVGAWEDFQKQPDQTYTLLMKQLTDSGQQKGYQVETKTIQVDGWNARELSIKATEALGSRAVIVITPKKLFTVTFTGPIFEKGYEHFSNPYFNNFIPK